MSHPQFRVGCAGWAIPKVHAPQFPVSGSHLARYAQRFNAVEINSSFYRPHRRSTYERWAAAVPDDFAFAVKAPREITHALRLAQTEAVLDAFLAEVTGLGKKLGPVLFQLPPQLKFELRLASSFFANVRAHFQGDVVCEPRHKGWFTAQADNLLKEFQVGRVAADPAVVPAAARPGGRHGSVYFRLHGSPHMYYSEYDSAWLEQLAEQMSGAAGHDHACWCIFDNTAKGAATTNAFALKNRLAAET
jgi:uncharacterized protein YecE (DUF72 family)